MHPQMSNIHSSDSPPDHDSHLLPHMHSQESLYSHPSLNGMYTSLNHQIHPSADYLLDDDMHKHQSSVKLTNGPSSSFKPPFPSFTGTNRQRHHPPSTIIPSNSFRENSNAYIPPDLYNAQMTSPTQSHHPPFDSRPSFDYTGQTMINGGHKPSFSLPDHHGHPNISASHKMQQHASPPGQFNGFSGNFVNGLHISSQTPFGPHIPAGPPTALNGTAPSAVMSSTSMMMNGPGNAPPQQQQEDISTIFVVGFPDDMQEREFQNMFTFSSGFEAATLKIPNKEYTSYGTATGASSGIRASSSSAYPTTFSGSNDPYAQSAVVVEGGRDGMSSWPSGAMDESTSQFITGGSAGLNMPPRKQIIGFAKFRSREEAVLARDQLQGRRVDIEKGAVLKAEMAKKNLHTKRGVGPVAGGLVNPGQTPVGQSQSAPNGMPLNGVGPNELYALESRDRDFNAIRIPYQLSDMPNVQGPMRRDPREEEERKEAALAAMGLGQVVHRGAREREEDERERRRYDKEMARMRPVNTAAYDAFYSVPQGMSRQTSNNAMLLPAEDDSSQSPYPIPNLPLQHDDDVGPWDCIGRPGMSSAISIGKTPTSHRSSSPVDPTLFEPASFEAPRSFSPSHRSYNERSSDSGTSSVNGGGSQSGRSSGNEDLARAVSGLAVSTNRGNTSPQLPSPSSGASSGGSTRNGVDQNPPINTLYVGNLPISPLPLGYPSDALEENLRDLFQRQPGFRRLSFKQKNTGPMCFVEFEDVPYASKAMSELYGNTLNGLVKAGGIRLSYSKNPLGVRTPTSANGQLQQQQTSPFPVTPSPFVPQEDRHNFAYRDLPGISTANHGFHGSSPPPPRFFSASPPAIHFGASSGTNTNVSRGGSYAYTLSSPTGLGGTSFSPFGLSHPQSSIPDQSQIDPQDQHTHHFMPRALSPNTYNVEPARAG